MATVWRPDQAGAQVVTAQAEFCPHLHGRVLIIEFGRIVKQLAVAMNCHDLPWIAMNCHELPWFANASQKPSMGTQAFGLRYSMCTDLIAFWKEIQNPNEVVPGSPDVQSDLEHIEIPWDTTISPRCTVVLKVSDTFLWNLWNPSRQYQAFAKNYAILRVWGPGRVIVRCGQWGSLLLNITADRGHLHLSNPNGKSNEIHSSDFQQNPRYIVPYWKFQ